MHAKVRHSRYETERVSSQTSHTFPGPTSRVRVNLRSKLYQRPEKNFLYYCNMKRNSYYTGIIVNLVMNPYKSILKYRKKRESVWTMYEQKRNTNELFLIKILVSFYLVFYGLMVCAGLLLLFSYIFIF